jgi:hypothetical protein
MVGITCNGECASKEGLPEDSPSIVEPKSELFLQSAFADMRVQATDCGMRQ